VKPVVCLPKACLDDNVNCPVCEHENSRASLGRSAYPLGKSGENRYLFEQLPMVDPPLPRRTDPIRGLGISGCGGV
jgi:hypothetical protein